MPVSNQVRDWADRYWREGEGLALVIWHARKHGAASDRARELAEDAIQVVLIRVLEKYGDRPDFVSEYRHFRNYVTRAAVNDLRDQARRKRKLVALATEPERSARSDPRLEAIRQGLERLPGNDRELLRSSFEDGQTLDELADRHLPLDGRSPNARRLVMRRQLRATQAALREELLLSFPELDWPEEPPLPTD